MKSLCEPCLAHGIDVTQHLVYGLSAVRHLHISLRTYALTQRDYLIVLAYLASQTLYVAALQLTLQPGVEKKSLALCLYAEPVGVNLAFVVGTGIKISEIPSKCGTYFIISLKLVLSMLSAGLP